MTVERAIEYRRRTFRYGQADFRHIRLNHWPYVDKDPLLRRLEQEHYTFLIRPRWIGKLMWVSLLGNFYIRFSADDFDATLADSTLKGCPNRTGGGIRWFWTHVSPRGGIKPFARSSSP